MTDEIGIDEVIECEVSEELTKNTEDEEAT